MMHHDRVVDVVGSVSRPGWVRDVAVPQDLDELCGQLHGVVALPARLFWSGPDPRGVRWDLADPTRRRDLYEIILVEGKWRPTYAIVMVTTTQVPSRALASQVHSSLVDVAALLDR